jgi:uncharacterized membrane protein
MTEPSPATPPGVLYDAVLSPHRSLPPRGFAALMLFLAAVSFALGLAFLLHGAWPVTPFLGLDLLLVYLAFRMSYRQARLREELRLTEESLTVDRIDRRGRRRHWRFQPFWLRVTLEEQDEHSNRLVLTSHGRSLVVGSFLGPAERRGIAGDLKDALARWKARLSTSHDL